METALAVLLAFVAAAWICGLTISAARHLQLGVDEAEGVQKMHSHWVPRLGGVPIFVALVLALLLAAWWGHNRFVNETAFLIVCLLPAFGVGLVEDITRRAGVVTRLVFTMIAAALGWWLLGAGLFRLDIGVVDGWLAANAFGAFVLTLVAAAGLAHATNIIDGCNGLSGFVSTMVLIALGYVAGQVGDEFLARVSFLAAAAIAGFLVWNFPFGKIFLGDAGAYLIGFGIAEISILLVARNPEVSPWFPLLLMVYPVWETLFSMGRRAKYGLSQMSQPDSLHLHQLILRRVVRFPNGLHWTPAGKLMRNSVTSIYLWVLTLFCVVPAVMFWDRTDVLMGFAVLFVATYLALYGMLVRFRLAKLFRRRAPADAAASGGSAST